MREYARIAPTFWTRGSGKKLRGNPDAQVVAFYLFTGPNATMIGLYHLAIPTMAHETGLPIDRARAALRVVCDLGIAMYDEEDELVYLPEGARYQIGHALGGGDPRKKGVENALDPFAGHPFVAYFVKKYQKPFSLTNTAKLEATPEHLQGTSVAPYKPLRSQDQDQAQDQAKQETEKDIRFETPPPSGAGLSSVFDLGHLAAPADDCPGCDLAPVGPEETPVPATGSGLEAPGASPDEPAPVSVAAGPVLPQPEPPATASPADPLPDAAPVAPSPKASNPKALALPFALEPTTQRHDPVAAIFAEYLAAWRRTMKGRRPPKLDDKRRKLTIARLREFTEDELKSAARGVFASTWNIENKQTDYDLVMRDAKHVEKFMACDEESRPQSVSTEKPAWMNQLPRRTITLRDVEALADDEPDWNENLAPITAPETP